MRFSSAHIKQQLLRHILDGHYKPGQKLPTISELSQILQVSTKTVQKAIHALSADGLIAAKPRVGLTVIAPPPLAIRSRCIGLFHLHPPKYLKQGPYPKSVIDAAQHELKKAGYTLSPCSLVELDRLNLVSSISKKHLSGALLFELDSDPLILELREARLPMVSMDYDAYRHGLSSVLFDNLHGTFQATKRLIAAGHRRIAFLRPLVKNVFSNSNSLDWIEDLRMNGYRLCMLDAGLTPVVLEYENDRPAAHALLVNVFAHRPAPTALVCTADWSALVIAQVVQQLGFRIPADLSVVGFGDARAEFAPGQFLSSVHADYASMGRQGARLLLNALQGEQARREILPVKVVDYDSIGVLPSESANRANESGAVVAAK